MKWKKKQWMNVINVINVHYDGKEAMHINWHQWSNKDLHHPLNWSLKDSLGNQNSFFYGIAIKPPFGIFIFKSASQNFHPYSSQIHHSVLIKMWTSTLAQL